jgi:hypothetical protein
VGTIILPLEHDVPDSVQVARCPHRLPADRQGGAQAWLVIGWSSGAAELPTMRRLRLLESRLIRRRRHALAGERGFRDAPTREVAYASVPWRGAHGCTPLVAWLSA